MTAAMSRNGTPSSATPCNRDPAGAASSASRYRRVQRVDAGPPVGPVPDVRGDAFVAGNVDQAVGKAVVIECAVHQWRQPDDRRSHATFGQRDRSVLRVDPRTALGGVVLGRGPSLYDCRQQQRSRGDDQRSVGAREHLAHCLDRAQVRLAGTHEVAVEIVAVGEVNDAVGCRGGLPQAVDVVEVASMRRRARRGQGGRTLVRPSQAADSVPGVAEFGDDGRADVPGRAGNKNVRGRSLLIDAIKSMTTREACPSPISHHAMQFRHHTSS